LPLDLTTELALALDLADAADAVTLPRYRAADLEIRHKADASHVTDADTGAEAAMRTLLAQHRPEHAVLGEEEGLIGDPASSSRWILDPIDGTASFVRGLPIWGTLIALEHEGEIVVGVASAPALGRRWWAARGLGASSDQGSLQVSSVDRLEDAHLGHASISSWQEHGRGPQFDALAHRVWRSRGVGDFWMHVLVAEGVFDLAAEPTVSLWDLAAVQVIVEEAGGRFTDLSGVARADGGSALSTNGLLHDAALAALL
jgi:histidinol-phosphatase